MTFDGSFDPLRLNADVTLSNGGGAVSQKALSKRDVIPSGFVNLRGAPLAETVCTDALETPDDRVAHFEVAHLENYTQPETSKLHIRLHTVLRQAKKEEASFDASSQKTLFYKAFPLT